MDVVCWERPKVKRRATEPAGGTKAASESTVRELTSLDLFCGIGGMALGASMAGFKHLAVIDHSKHCLAVIEANKVAGVKHYADWNALDEDIARLDLSKWAGKVSLLTGGPPCQPFSQAGKRLGDRDPRDMFQHAVRAVHQIRPQTFLYENVKGLRTTSFSRYADYIRLALAYASIPREPGERWTDHCARLELDHLRGREKAAYRVLAIDINAADYGVPQHRERLLFLGVSSSITADMVLPVPTHSKDALAKAMWVTGEYWDRHKIASSDRPARPGEEVLVALKESQLAYETLPWRTVRDAIADLPEPTSVSAAAIKGHWLIEGARAYAGHSGSDLDSIAKTLKAGDHGVPGGENMLRTPAGDVRYFTLRECARLQAFPDDVLLPTPWTRTMGAIGNAVPVTVATLFAGTMKSAWESQ